jgi:glutamate dehydrogenase
MPDPKKISQDLHGSFDRTLDEVVEWFCKVMPAAYFQDTDHSTQLAHLRAMIAAKASGMPYEFKFGGADDHQVTYIRQTNRPGILAEVTKDLPHDFHLTAAKIHTSDDDQLVIVTFLAGEPARFDKSDPEQKKKLDQTIEYAARKQPDWSADSVRAFFDRCFGEDILALSPLRIAKHWSIFRAVSGTEGVHVELEPEADGKHTRITVAAGNAPNRMMLERVSRRLSRLNVNINRAHVDSISDGDNGVVNFLGFVVVAPDGRQIAPESDLGRQIRKDLLRIRWFDSNTLELLSKFPNDPELTLGRAELIVALCDLTHQILVKAKPADLRDGDSLDSEPNPATKGFTRERIGSAAVNNIGISIKIAQLFLERFDPANPLADAVFESHAQAIRSEIAGKAFVSADGRTILDKMVEAVGAVLRTNVFVESRYALSMRLDPRIMAGPDRPNAPYGVYFVHGCEFIGFHVRFRDIARGGVRGVAPATKDRHHTEMSRVYDEAYGLASAQQLKNKDIPEGGAKAVILIEPPSKGGFEAGRVARAVKAFADSLLDLITSDPATKSRVVDRLGRTELLYLGPDENITPEHIVWITQRAKRRGYSVPDALMSSKPGGGINHKTYGVTSEGITVFLEVALRHVGIDPNKQSFTVKITGGPDGDVAGNEIRILDRNYGQNAKIVAIGDGTGVGEDPEGLDHQELLRLFREAKGIAEFDKKKLSAKGRVVSVKEPDGENLRNTMHFRIESDVFVPGGGRPNTINDGNWRQFLKANGEPSSPVIVEGANLFLTDGAREELTKKGCFIVKDSSANKCGVICSSFEIVACMLLDEQHFLEIKNEYVEEVLVRLRDLARQEAELLLRLNLHDPHEPLYRVSKKVSLAIIKAADAFMAAIDFLMKESEPHLRRLVVDHLPPVLLETVGESFWERIPPSYLRWMMAKSLAARMVYREGYKEIEAMSDDALPKIAVRYLRLDAERADLARHATGDGARVAHFLKSCGLLSMLTEA